MKTIHVLWAILAIVLIDQCSSLKPPPTEDLKLKAKLTDEFVEILNEDTSAYVIKDTITVSLPPIALHKATVVPPAGRSATPFDTVYVQTIVTKRGNVKRAWIDWSPNKYFNKAVLKAIAQWKFQPALRRGVPIDTLIKLAIPLQ
jgi:TonB family protein